ncbi:MAG: RrF2 family transcriptional regulator [Raoultibacter sp.]|jgi:Rrf2 family protein
MDITRRSDYACRILRAVYYSDDQCISVSEISKNEDIPYSFARSIQHDLVKHGLIKTIRGVHGGVILNCDPKEVTLRDVLEAVQGPVSMAVCSTDPDYCDKSEGCAYHKAWSGADKILQDYFSSITLEEMFQMGAEHPAIKEALG